VHRAKCSAARNARSRDISADLEQMYAPGVKGRSRHERRRGGVVKKGERKEEAERKRRGNGERRGEVLGEDSPLDALSRFLYVYASVGMHASRGWQVSPVPGPLVTRASGRGTISCLVPWFETSRHPKKATGIPCIIHA
jgi:hypothetical protein